MDYYEIDEVFDEAPTTTLNSRLVRLLKLENLEIGDEIDLSCIGRVLEIEAAEGEDGVTETRLTLELQIMPRTKGQPDQILL